METTIHRDGTYTLKNLTPAHMWMISNALAEVDSAGWTTDMEMAHYQITRAIRDMRDREWAALSK